METSINKLIFMRGLKKMVETVKNIGDVESADSYCPGTTKPHKQLGIGHHFKDGCCDVCHTVMEIDTREESEFIPCPCQEYGPTKAMKMAEDKLKDYFEDKKEGA